MLQQPLLLQRVVDIATEIGSWISNLFLHCPVRFGPQGLLPSLTNSDQPPSEQRPSHLFAAEGWEGDADVSDWEPFRLLGRSMIDYIADYYQRVESLPVSARVEPGYLKVQVDEGCEPHGRYYNPVHVVRMCRTHRSRSNGFTW